MVFVAFGMAFTFEWNPLAINLLVSAFRICGIGIDVSQLIPMNSMWGEGNRRRRRYGPRISCWLSFRRRSRSLR